MITDMFLGAADNKATTWVMVALLVVLVVVLLVVPVFTNKKRSKQTMEMHNSLQPGDKIKTVGGIIGVIKEIRKISPHDSEMVIETGEGDNKSTMTFDIQALYQVIERVARPEAENHAVFEDHDEKVEETAPIEDAPVAEEPVKAEEPTVKEEVQPKDEVVAAEVDATPEKAEEAATVAETETVVTEEPEKAESAVEQHKPAAKKATPAKKKPVSSAKNSTKK